MLIIFFHYKINFFFHKICYIKCFFPHKPYNIQHMNGIQIFLIILFSYHVNIILIYLEHIDDN